jgi:acyl carrier protein
MKIDFYKVKEMIVESGAEIIDDDSATVDSSFESIGLDSLDMFGLFTEISHAYGVIIPDEEVDKLLSFNDLIIYVNKFVQIES